MSQIISYDRQNPFHSKVVSRYRLNATDSSKETWHIVLDLKGSNISYRPGDSIAIYPENDDHSVQKILEAQNISPDASVEDPRTGQNMTFLQWLTKKANLSKPTTKLLEAVGLNEEMAALYTVPELLQEHPGKFSSASELMPHLAPLLPRFYSISSSQMSVGDEVHCTIANVRYEVNNKPRVGVCSHYLCSMLEERLSKVAVYIQPTKDFILPEDNMVPIIMIGPGTGVAPFRAFMQERLHRGAHTDKNWLFFGERHEKQDFFYQEYWNTLVKQGHLRLDAAFSRDQEHKVYVQHKMWENRKELWQYLQDGAKLYVCGDANRMAKDVDAMLQQIASSEGGLSVDEAKAYFTALRKEKRYLRDVY